MFVCLMVFNATFNNISVIWWSSPGPPVSSTNKTDRNDITEILLKVALNTITPTLYYIAVVSDKTTRQNRTDL